MTDQTLGRNVKDRVFSWAYGGGWGYATGWGGSTTSLVDRTRMPFGYFLPREEYGQVSEELVGENVRECLGLEATS